MRFLRIVLTVMVFLIISSGLSHGSLGQGHVYVAEKLLTKMPTQLKSLVEKEKSAYLAGANGVDIIYWAYYKAFFLYRELPNSSAAEFDLHTNTLGYHTGQTALDILSEAKKYSIKEKAFALGWLTHWLTDAYVHTLIGNYGGDYRDNEDPNKCTPTGSCRHTQLELAESKHLCSSERYATYGPFLSTYTLSKGDLPEDFIEDLFKKHKFVAAEYKDGYMHGKGKVTRQYPFIGTRIEDGESDFRANLETGRASVQSAIECTQSSCSKKSNDCSGTQTGSMSQSVWQQNKQSYLLDKNDYIDINNAIRINVDKLEVKDGSLRALIEANDTQLYGKFLVEWDRVISDLETFVDNNQLFHIVQAFLGPAEVDPAEEKAKEALERVLNQIPNILTPRNQMYLFDPKTTKRYADGTLRGAPDIKSIAYEIASTCDGGKAFNKLQSGTVPITFHDPQKQRIKLFGSKSGSAEIKDVKLEGDGDRSCDFVLLVSFLNPDTGQGSYMLGTGKEGSAEKVKVFTRNPTAPADPDFRYLEYDWVSGDYKNSDLKSRAEAKYRWLKESVAYLEALKEYDRKRYNAFEKSVTGSIVREFVSQYPPRYEKDFKLPDGPEKDLCGETFGDIASRLRGFDGDCWSALNSGCKTVGTREVTRKVDGKDMKILESVTSCDAPCGKAQTCSNVLKVHTGELGYADSLQDYVNERQIKCLGDAGAANGKHQRELDKKIKELPESIPYKRYQEFAGFNDWKGFLTAVEKVKQEFDLPDPIPSPIVLPWTYTSPCGGGGAVVVGGNLQISIKKNPEKTAYVMGEKITLAAAATGGKAPYSYQWSGDCEGKDATATCPFSKAGQNRVNVRVKDAGGDTGEASITVEVDRLQLDLTFDPEEPFVGQELKAKLSVKPEVKEIDFRWMPVPDNAKPSMESRDGREITFFLKDDKAAEIKVMVLVPKSGANLGEAKNNIKAKKYAVNVTGPRAVGPKPKVWKEGVGLVEVENAVAVDEVAEFAADTQPAALTGPVKYKWTATGDSCALSNATSRAARATASAAGGCALSVVIMDRNDVQLGEGKGSFDATVTREEIRQGQERARNVDNAKKKVQDAKVKERKGDLDGAIVDVDGALKLDEKNKEAAALSAKFRKDRETIGIQLGKAKTLMGENRFPDAQRELTVAKNLHGLYLPVLETDRELGDKWRAYDSQVRDKIYEVRSASERKEFGKALEIAAAWRASTKLDPYADRELKQQEDWARKWKAEKDRQIGILKDAGDKVKNYDYAGALKSTMRDLPTGRTFITAPSPSTRRPWSCAARLSRRTNAWES